METPEGFSRSFVIATDGYVDVEREVFDLIRRSLNHANVYAFGIGSSVNRYIIEGIANVGQGLPFIVTDGDNAGEKAENFREYIQNPLLTNISIKFSGFDVYDVEPVSQPDLLAERPIIVYGKYKGSASGEIILKGNTNKASIRKVIDVNDIIPEQDNKALRYLWARKKILFFALK